MKFKVGDRVMVVKIVPITDIYLFAELINKVGIITSILSKNDKHPIQVRLDRDKHETGFKKSELKICNDQLIKSYFGIENE